MLERILLGLGGIEIVLGGLMTAYPLWLPQSVGLIMVAIGVITVVAAVLGFIPRMRRFFSAEPSQGIGGKGGDATAKGDRVTAIAGPGGPAGTHGRGGDGGSASVEGDDSLAGGGGGGAAGQIGVWYPPARSGYEVAMRKLGLPVDPDLARYGRGGVGGSPAGRWDEKMAVCRATALGIPQGTPRARPTRHSSRAGRPPQPSLGSAG